MGIASVLTEVFSFSTEKNWEKEFRGHRYIW